MSKKIVIAALSSAALFNVQAAEWSLTGGLNPSLTYDDNIFMRESNTQGDYHTTMTPTLKMAYETDRSEVSLSTGYVMDRYHTSSHLDNDDPFFKLNTAYKTQRSTWGLGLEFSERSSRSDAADDTGDFETNSTSTTKSISPSFSYQLTERDALSLSASYSEKTYSTTDFSDSKNRSVSSHWQHQFTERFNGGISLSASNNKSIGLLELTDDDTYNLSLTSNYNISEIWGINGSVGVNQLNSQQTNLFGATDKTKSTAPSLSINVSYKTDVDQANLSISRSTSPSSTGDVNEQDKISMGWSRSLSETLTASIQGSYQTTNSAVDSGSDERENTDISPSINWQYSPDSTLSLSYNYRQQKESALNTNARSNAIMLTFNYDWNGINASR
ncbi:MAG: hypothetical protein KUG64_00860 [Cycloclasticus sp.]|nr:hypothetical protein [Cycloclasticus sp.]